MPGGRPYNAELRKLAIELNISTRNVRTLGGVERLRVMSPAARRILANAVLRNKEQCKKRMDDKAARVRGLGHGTTGAV
jgi:hypothetical protein